MKLRVSQERLEAATGEKKKHPMQFDKSICSRKDAFNPNASQSDYASEINIANTQVDINTSASGIKAGAFNIAAAEQRATWSVPAQDKPEEKSIKD
jgi:hypothetical protein